MDVEMSDELYHYGIKGQKWGVRRYQNADGSYTKEGLNRRLKESGATPTLTNRSRIKRLGKQQSRVGKRFDKYTNKILEDRKMGVKISDRRIKKAVNLGTQFRNYDYMAKDPKFLEITDNVQAVGLLTDIPVAAALVALGLTSVIPITTVGAVKGAIEGGVLSKKINDYYKDAFEESKNLSIEDLKKHGVIVQGGI